MPTSLNEIAGNVPDDGKAFLLKRMEDCHPNGSFGKQIGDRIRITEADILPVEGSKRTAAKVVMEVAVTTDMCNLGGALHGGCVAYLVDVGTTSCLFLVDGWTGVDHLSSAMNIIYHSPAVVGTTLRIISTVVAIGGRVGTMKCEIWNKERGSLVASGTHMKMRMRSNSASL